MADKIVWVNGFVCPTLPAVFLFFLATAVHAQRMTESKVTIRYLPTDFAIRELDNPSWKKGDVTSVSTYWSGKDAQAGRRFEVRTLWSDTSLYLRFEASQSEPLVISQERDVSKKTMRLWDRDVVEIFLAPDRTQPRKYLEFEVAPTGEWIDLAIDYTGLERKTNWDFRSGMTSSARIEKDKVFMTLRIPWTAFGVAPKPGDVWLGNLFRCVGKDPTRGYLAWRPTMTEQPNFHVPEKFGEFVFAK